MSSLVLKFEDFEEKIQSQRSKVDKCKMIFRLDTIREYLYHLGNPQNKMRFIHLAGN